jgi:hypothetical protein
VLLYSGALAVFYLFVKKATRTWSNRSHALTIPRTMPSPVSSQVEKGESLHDIAPRLQQFLEHLSHNRRSKLLPRWNFSHPGDPFASPLEKLLSTLIDHKRQYLEVHDAIILPHNLEDIVTERFSQSSVALIDARDAHHC